MAKPITPEQLAASGTEDGHQAALFCWAAIARSTYPELRYMFAIPNGGLRNIRVASNLKATGVKKGVPDIMLPVKRGLYSGLFIELKREASLNKKEGVISTEQTEFINFLCTQQFIAIVCYGWVCAKNEIAKYIELK